MAMIGTDVGAGIPSSASHGSGKVASHGAGSSRTGRRSAPGAFDALMSDLGADGSQDSSAAADASNESGATGDSARRDTTSSSRPGTHGSTAGFGTSRGRQTDAERGARGRSGSLPDNDGEADTQVAVRERYVSGDHGRHAEAGPGTPHDVVATDSGASDVVGWSEIVLPRQQTQVAVTPRAFDGSVADGQSVDSSEVSPAMDRQDSTPDRMLSGGRWAVGLEQQKTTVSEEARAAEAQGLPVAELLDATNQTGDAPTTNGAQTSVQVASPDVGRPRAATGVSTVLDPLRRSDSMSELDVRNRHTGTTSPGFENRKTVLAELRRALAAMSRESDVSIGKTPQTEREAGSVADANKVTDLLDASTASLGPEVPAPDPSALEDDGEGIVEPDHDLVSSGAAGGSEVGVARELGRESTVGDMQSGARWQSFQTAAGQLPRRERGEANAFAPLGRTNGEASVPPALSQSGTGARGAASFAEPKSLDALSASEATVRERSLSPAVQGAVKEQAATGAQFAEVESDHQGQVEVGDATHENATVTSVSDGALDDLVSNTTGSSQSVRPESTLPGQRAPGQVRQTQLANRESGARRYVAAADPQQMNVANVTGDGSSQVLSVSASALEGQTEVQPHAGSRPRVEGRPSLRAGTMQKPVAGQVKAVDALPSGQTPPVEASLAASKDESQRVAPGGAENSATGAAVTTATAGSTKATEHERQFQLEPEFSSPTVTGTDANASPSKPGRADAAAISLTSEKTTRPSAHAARAIAAFQAAALASAASATSPDAVISVPRTTFDPALEPQVHAQLVNAVRLQAEQGGGQARITLNPTFLGDVEIDVRTEGASVTASVHAANAEVREWMRTNESALRQSLADQGLSLDRFVIVDEDADSGQSRGERESRKQDDRQGEWQRRQRQTPEHSTFEVVL